MEVELRWRWTMGGQERNGNNGVTRCIEGNCIFVAELAEFLRAILHEHRQRLARVLHLIRKESSRVKSRSQNEPTKQTNAAFHDEHFSFAPP